MKSGSRDAEDRLMPLVYGELRRIARLQLRNEHRSPSMQPTLLVNEAYLRLTGTHTLDWQGRSHFFAVSATIMRRILVDHARSSNARKRGNGWDAVSLREGILPISARAPEILALDEA